METEKKRYIVKGLKKNQNNIEIADAGFIVKYASGYLDITNELVKRHDFINCDLNSAQFISTEFSDCSFQEVNFSNARFIGNQIISNTFSKCSFNDTAFIVKGSQITEIINCIFNNCIFSNLAVDYTLFRNCKFIDCKIKKTDFNGSRFENCFFSGKISDSFFRSKIRHLPIYGVFNKLIGKVVDDHDLKNKMIDVDFSTCELDGISFCDGVDLSHCKFPINERYLYIKDVMLTYTQAYDYINSNWTGEDLRLGNIVFETILMSKYKGNNQINDLIDFNLITENINDTFSKKLKDVLIKYSI